MLPSEHKEQQAKLERAQLAKAKRENTFRAVLGTSDGQHFVWLLANEAGWRAPSMVRSDTQETAYNEGRRSVASNLMDECQRLAPEAFVELVKKGLQKENSDALEAAAHAVPAPKDSQSR